MSPRSFEGGGPSLADMEFKADQEEATVVKPIEIEEEAKLAQAVDEIFEPKISQKTTRESLEASNASLFMKEYWNRTKGDPLGIPPDRLEQAAFYAQNYLTALVEKVNNPDVKIKLSSDQEEKKYKQFANYIVGEWDREKARQAQREARRLKRAA